MLGSQQGGCWAPAEPRPHSRPLLVTFMHYTNCPRGHTPSLHPQARVAPLGPDVTGPQRQSQSLTLGQEPGAKAGDTLVGCWASTHNEKTYRGTVLLPCVTGSLSSCFL